MVEAKVSLLSLLEREYLGRPGQWQVNRSDMEAAPSVELLPGLLGPGLFPFGSPGPAWWGRDVQCLENAGRGQAC